MSSCDLEKLMGLGREKLAADAMVERIEKTQARVRALFKRLPEWVRFQG